MQNVIFFFPSKKSGHQQMTVPFFLLLSIISHPSRKQAAPMWMKSSSTHKQPLTHHSCWRLHCKHAHTKAVGGWQEWVKREFYLSNRGTVQINAVERPQIWSQWGAEASDLHDICILWLDCSSVKWEPGRLWRRVIIYNLAKLAENQHKKWQFTSYTCSCLHWYSHCAVSACG